MKKIIYSLVIMIAAGSLFTSCIEPVEPVGIFDLREAKARYYDALSKLRLADAELQLANAAFRDAQTKLKLAQVEEQNLKNQLDSLKVELQKAKDAYTKQELTLKLDSLIRHYDSLKVAQEEALALAVQKYQNTLRQIELDALGLSQAEQDKLKDAVEKYETALEEYLTAQRNVTDAEKNLWEAEYDWNNAMDTKGIFYDSEYKAPGEPDGKWINLGVDQIAYYESVVEYYTAVAALYQVVYEALSDPEMSDPAKWAEEIADLDEQIAGLKYQRYEVTKDSTEYMNNVFCDGNKEYALTIKNWMNANGIYKLMGAMYFEDENGDLHLMNEPIAPGDEGFDPYEYYGTYIEMPKLETDGSVAYLKYKYILNDYFTQGSEVENVDDPAIAPYDHHFIEEEGSDFVLYVNQMMKDFILGGETEKPFVYKDANGTPHEAYYGLEGALSVLKRQLVLVDSGKTPEELKKDAEDALKTWKEDRDILDKGLAEYAPYKTALATYNEKKAAYDKAVQDDAEGNSGLAAATQKLIDELNGVVGHADYSTPDTTALVDAIVAFATAREKYLPYTAYKNNSGIDSTIFYYAFATSPVIIDSTYHFKDLTVALLRTKPYFAQRWHNIGVKPEVSDPAAYPTGDWMNGLELSPGEWEFEGAFMNIFAQLLGQDVANVIENPTLAPVTAAMLNGGNAFYNTYEYVPAAGTTPAYMKSIATGEKFVNPDVAKAKTALTTAETGVKNAAKKFVEVYNKFWAVSVTTDISGEPYTKFNAYFTAAANKKAEKLAEAEKQFKIGKDEAYLKLDHKCYKLETFTEPYNVVTFTDDNIDYTRALGAILVSVDPNSTHNEGCFEAWAIQPAIFGSADGTKKSEFYKYMQAEYLYLMATASVEEIIKNIEGWIKDVKAAFAANEAAAKAEQEAVEKLYADYAKVYEELTGMPASGDAYDDAVWVSTEIAEPANYTDWDVYQVQVAVNTYAAVWYLGGKQAEWAEEFMPKFPEKLAEWRTIYAQTEEEIKHRENIKKDLEDAYVAALKVAAEQYDITIDPTSDTVKEIYEDMLAGIEKEIVTALQNITEAEKALAKAEAGYDAQQILIELRQHQLELAQAKLLDAEIKLAAAEAYYNEVLTALFGQN